MLIPISSLGNVASLRRGLRGVPRFRNSGFGATSFTPENCAPTDSACVNRNAVNSLVNQVSLGTDEANAARNQCISNANLNPNPAAGIATCNAQWPTGYSYNTPYTGNPSDIVTPASAVAKFNADSAATYLANVLQLQRGGQTPAAIAAALGPAYIPFTPAAAASPPSPSINPGRVSISNTTRPGQQSFYPSDSYQVQISGATPNQPVTAAATQNGKSTGTTPFGNTDSAGNFSITGTMSSDQIGNWVEVWMVAGLQSGTASFQVLQSPGPTPGQSTTPPDPTAPPPPAQPPQPPAPASSPFLSFLQTGFTIGSLTIPFWWVGLGALGVFVFAEKGRD